MICIACASNASDEGQEALPITLQTEQTIHPSRVFWGDTHVHSANSLDAALFGNRLGPDAIYRFAKGEVVRSSSGVEAKLERPLDFVVVADHAEVMGLAPLLNAGDELLQSDPFGNELYEAFQAGGTASQQAVFKLVGKISRGEDPFPSIDLSESVWFQNNALADYHNAPGTFTALIGYEWTSMPAGNNLHRVVVFRDGAEKADQTLPFSFFDSADPERLWDHLELYEEETGGQALAIPHNGNLSNGLMFADTRYGGAPIDKAYADRRMRWEPIVEVTQMKGDGETHPALSQGDEFADFETWDKANVIAFAPKTPDMLRFEYARSALNLGLELEEKGAGNPYRFGMIGSTDSHTSLATVEEKSFFGASTLTEPSANRWQSRVITSQVDPSLSVFGAEEVAGGLAAVWATENTCEAIFDALRRKEVYATTGPRMKVRVFAGFDFELDDLRQPDFETQGYTRGVPMGGDLVASEDGAPPRFAVRAMRDPDGANLDRVQVIKGSLRGDGSAYERVFDIACSNQRSIYRDRCDGLVGNTVDLENASFTNEIGAVELSAVWEDPDFDPATPAWYYIRVLEIPTPRWTAYDSARLGAVLPDDLPKIIQERAYTSPIWYRPEP